MLSLVIAGCYQPTQTLCEGSCDELDASAKPECVGTAGFGLLGEQCFTPGEPFAITQPGSLDTSNDSRCAPERADRCWIAAASIQIDQRLDVVGNRPLVLWTTGTISIGSLGVLDVASHSMGTAKIGPGSNAGSCGVTAGSSLASTPGVGGGGSGGGFRSGGGVGGDGRNGVATSPGAAGLRQPLAFRGGCDGGVGGLSTRDAGRGGGAVYLMARGTISIAGAIDASGSGGQGGSSGSDLSGASGGGSGGLIGIEGDMVATPSARLSALGGSGGAGADQSGTGADGRDPTISPQPAKAEGPAGTITSNNGGAGCDLGGNDAVNGGSVGGGGIGSGGGGGGGCGWIVIYGQSDVASAKIAPPPELIPP